MPTDQKRNTDESSSGNPSNADPSTKRIKTDDPSQNAKPAEDKGKAKVTFNYYLYARDLSVCLHVDVPLIRFASIHELIACNTYVSRQRKKKKIPSLTSSCAVRTTGFFFIIN